LAVFLDIAEVGEADPSSFHEGQWIKTKNNAKRMLPQRA